MATLNKMISIKELAEKENKLAAGHRSCAGCGFPPVIRTVLSATDKPVVTSCATGCLEVTTTIYPQTSWKVPFIHSAFENSAATIAGVESAYNALKRKGLVKEEVKFIAFGGDGGTYDIGLQSLSGALERGHDFVYVCYDNEAYMNCLSLDSLITTKDGLKKITNVKKGDMVYAFDQRTYQLVLKKCMGVFDNGKKRVYDIETLHHNIKATGNHPFLVLQRNGRGKKNEFVWRILERLKKGDEIVVLKNLNMNVSYEFKKIKISRKGDYKVNKIRQITLPKRSNEDVMEYLGMFVGDGWIRINKAEVGFALPKNTKARKRLMELNKKVCGIDVTRLDDNYVYIDSINLARFIESLGFGKNAREKIVPDWVFTLPEKEKKAFVDGMMLTDGYKIDNSHRYVSASSELLKRLRLLLQTMGYRVGKIHQQTKLKGTYVVYRKLLKDSTYSYICFSKRGKWNISKYPSQYKYQNFLVDNKNFETEKITRITAGKVEPTLDLRVEGEHNFIAEGIVVHNTGIQRSSATPFGAATTTTPAGKVHPGKEIFKKDIMKVVAAHNIPYLAQAAMHDLPDLYEKAKKALEVKGPAFINVFAPCVPGWKYPSAQSVEISRLATQCNFWPLYEIENGVYKLNHKPSKPIPVVDYLKTQGRFKHLFKRQDILDKIQKHVDDEWDKLLKDCGE